MSSSAASPLGQHHGHAFRVLGPLGMDALQLDAKHLLAEKHQRIERLVLRHGCEAAIDHQRGEEGLHRAYAPCLTILLPMMRFCAKSEFHEIANPLVLDKSVPHNVVDVLDRIVSHQVVSRRYAHMTSAPTMKLFRESICCRACGHEWTGYLHGFSRGHAVLVSGERVAFIPDDLLYSFAEHVSLGHNFAAPLVALGWRHMESCPACGATDFVGAYNQQAMVDLPFIPFDEHDFIPTATGWTLSERANDKIRKG